jgi:hypothetical protein
MPIRLAGHPRTVGADSGARGVYPPAYAKVVP